MTFDDVEEFLKFLDDVSLELACLLDIDGERDLKRIYSKQKSVFGPKLKGIGKSSNILTATQAGKRQQKATNKQQPNRAKGRRQAKLIEGSTDIKDHAIPDDSQIHAHQQTQQQQLQHHQHHHPNQHSQLHQHHHQQSQIHDLNTSKSLDGGPEAHPLEVQLGLGLTDELSIEHGSSISPATHLSPMDPSPLGQFIHPIGQQHYYNPSRVQLDPFHIHEEFTSHEPVPLANDAAHPLVGSEHHHTAVHHHHHHHHQQQQQQSQLMHDSQQHQAQNSIVTSQQHQTSASNFSTLNTMTACYTQPPVIHHHGSHHQHQHQHHLHQQLQQQPPPPPASQQQQQHQDQQDHHHASVQYQTLDNQWLGSSGMTADSGIHLLESHNHGTIDHVVPISPLPNQTLDHVQFGSSLYHHSYYNHQAEHLDPFHQITNDDFSTNSTTLAPEGPTSINQIHRMQQDPQQQQQQQQQQHQHSHRVACLELNNGQNNYDQPHNQIHQSQPGTQQLQNPNPTYGNEHQHSNSGGHQQHHHPHAHHIMPHLVSGIEPSNVIIQDINLASATWASSDDLYSI